MVAIASAKEMALSLAGVGVSVIPIRRGEKRPMGQWEKYQKKPATVEQVERWFRDDINYGIVCGEVSGFVVVDVDSYKDDFTQTYCSGFLPNTPLKCRTGRGGWHLFYRPDPKGTGCPSANFTKDGRRLAVEIKGNGGQVVGPGSVNAEGGVYSIYAGDFSPETLASLPVFDNRWFCKPKPEAKTSAPLLQNDWRGVPVAKRIEWCAKALGASSKHAVTDDGNAQLYNLALAGHRFALDEYHIGILLGDEASRNGCPWTEKEIARQVGNAYARASTAYGCAIVEHLEFVGSLKAADRPKPQAAAPKTEVPAISFAREKLEDFPVEDFFAKVPWMIELVDQLAEVEDLPRAPIVLSMLGAMSGAWAQWLKVEAKPGQVTPIQLYNVILMDSGGGKSKAIRILTNFLEDRFAWEEENLKDRNIVRKARLEAAKSDMRHHQRNLHGVALERALEKCRRRIEKYSKRIIFKKIVSDITPAKLTSEICEGNRNQVLVDTEGTFLKRASGRGCGQAADFEALKKAWSNDPMERDRKGGDESLKEFDPILTMIAATQPETIRDLATDMGSRLRGEGLVARLLVSMIPGTRNYTPPERRAIDEGLLERFEERTCVVRGQLQIDEKESGAPWERLYFTDEAQERSLHFRYEMKQFGHENKGLDDWVYRINEHAIRLSAYLHLLEHGKLGVQLPITLDTFERAARAVFGFFLDNTYAFCGLLREAPGEQQATHVAQELVAWSAKRKEFSVREARRGPKLVRQASPELVRQALELMEDNGYLECVEHRLSRGRRVAKQYRVLGGLRDI